MACQVKVKEGILQGKECSTFYGKKYYSFEGIPYAKPPVGKLRFRNPEPSENWTGVLDATKPGNKCLQANPYSNTSIDGSEDCLYLNIYTPVLPAEKLQKLPVIFFIHGGRLIFGHAYYYTPDYMIKNDVILVTVNYRLHIFGWLCLDLPECPGNAGLKDTVMALKWVNRNIEHFNGDSKNITVFGESAGGAIASSFLTSDMTAGLYSKVIAESGNCIADLFWGEEQPLPKAFNLASLLGKDLKDTKEALDLFLNASAEELCIAFASAELSQPQSTIRSYLLPVVEKPFPGVECFFKEHPRVCIREGRFHKVPVISTSNSHEGVIFFRDDEGNIRYEEDFHYYIPSFARIDRGTNKAIQIQKKIKEFYFKNKNISEAKTEYLNLISDSYFIRDIMIFTDSLSKYSDTVYSLKFSYFGNMHTRTMSKLGIKGATHGDMIQYQFYRKKKASQANEKDLNTVEFLSELFCNFAKNGTPTWRNQKTNWLPYTQTDKRTLVVDDDIKCDKNVDVERFEFWKRLLQEQCKL